MTESEEEKTLEIDENRLKIEAEMKREAKKANPNKSSIQRKNKSRIKRHGGLRKKWKRQNKTIFRIHYKMKFNQFFQE